MRKIFLFLLPAFLLLVGGLDAWGDVWEKVTDYSSLSTTDTYVIAGNVLGGSTWYSLKNNQVTTASNLAIGSTLTIEDNKITSTITADETWVLESTGTAGQFYIKSTKGSYYLQNAGATKSTINTKSGTDNNNKWKIHFADTNNDNTVTGLYNVGASREMAVYEGTGQTKTHDWRCYAGGNYGNIANAEVVLYKKKVSTATTTTIISTEITNTDLKNGTAAGSLSASVTVTSGGASVDGATVTWSSNATSVATVASNGAVTLVGIGSATITASYAGNGTYASSSSTYNITVTDTRTATTTTIDYSGITNTDLKNGTTAGSCSASVTVTSGGASVDGATVTWSSSDETVATINASTGAITLVAKGSTTITANYFGEGAYASSFGTYNLTVSDTRQVMSVSVTFNNSLYGTSYSGSDAHTHSSASGTVNNVTITATDGTTYFFIDDSETRVYDGGSMTISAPANYYITKIAFTGGSKWAISSVSSGSLSEKTWTGLANSIVFTPSARSDFKNATITLAKSSYTITPSTVSINDEYYASFCSPTNCTLPDGVTAYIGELNGDKSKLTLHAYNSQIIPANTGVILGSTSSSDYTLVATTDAAGSASGTNHLKGTIEAHNLHADSTYYVLGQKSGVVGFYTYSNSLPAYKAYFRVKTSDNSLAPSVLFAIEDENNATNIENVEADKETVKFIQNGQLFIKRDGIVYDALGRKIQ